MSRHHGKMVTGDICCLCSETQSAPGKIFKGSVYTGQDFFHLEMDFLSDLGVTPDGVCVGVGNNSSTLFNKFSKLRILEDVSAAEVVEELFEVFDSGIG